MLFNQFPRAAAVAAIIAATQLMASAQPKSGKVVYDESFAWAKEGTEDTPVYIETDSRYNIPVELIGEKNYGFGGGEFFQAGGSLMIDTFPDYRTTAEQGVDVFMKNLVITELPGLKAPVAEEHSDFTGDSFVAHWQAAEGATGYYLTVAEYDDQARKLIEPYFMADKYVEDTRCIVEAITPGAKYHYYVKSTDGASISDASNTIHVYKLATPANVNITESAEGFNLVWNSVPAATDYVADVRTRFTASADCTYAVASADFSALGGAGSVATPFIDAETPLATYPQLPGWEFTLSATAGGAAGVEYDADLAKYGFAASIKSPEYPMEVSSTGYLNITLNMASTYGNDVKVTYYTKTASGMDKEVSDQFTTTSDFAEYKTSIPSGKTPGYLTIAPVPNADGKGNVFIRNMSVKVKMPAGGVMELPYASTQTEATAASFAAPLIDDTYYLIDVTAYQRVPYQDLGFITRLTSDPSETLEFRPSTAVGAIAAGHDGPEEYYNLQGIRIDKPQPGNVYIRRRGDTVVKVLVK